MQIHPTINIFTDGSCHTQSLFGSWAAIVFVDGEKTVLSGTETDTTHQRMELMAVIKGLAFISTKYTGALFIQIVSDSQYVIGLPLRKQKLLAKNFITNNGNEIKNMDLVKTFYAAIEHLRITFTKIKAHQQKTGAPNYNIEADKLSRKLVRMDGGRQTSQN